MGGNSGSRNGSWSGGLCSLHHVDEVLLKSREDQHTILDYLRRKSKLMDTGCWEWLGSFLRGYPRCGGGLVHRLIYVLHTQSCVGDLKVCHTCDNPRCLNPDHLFKGTHQDNVDDQVSKLRQAHGERNGRAKLTDQDVRNIRRLYHRGTRNFGQVALSQRFGISQTGISEIVRGKKWKYVTQEFGS
jgi:hypothetical protein